MKDDQKGYIVVETLGAFTMLVLFVVSILSLINIVVVQARVHSAITQAAMTCSMYDYCFSAAGIDDEIVKIADRAENTRGEIAEFSNNIRVVMDGLSSLGGSNSISQDITTAQNVYESGSAAMEQTSGWVETLANDPKEMIGQLLALGADTGSRAAFTAIVRPMVGRYLTNGSQSGDEYLKKMNVVDGLAGLDFDDSTFLDKNGDVVIKVSYVVEYKFGSLPMPFDTGISIEQTVKTKAWLGGTGKGYGGG